MPVPGATTPLPKPSYRLWMKETAVPSPSTAQSRRCLPQAREPGAAASRRRRARSRVQQVADVRAVAHALERVLERQAHALDLAPRWARRWRGDRGPRERRRPASAAAARRRSRRGTRRSAPRPSAARSPRGHARRARCRTRSPARGRRGRERRALGRRDGAAGAESEGGRDLPRPAVVRARAASPTQAAAVTGPTLNPCSAAATASARSASSPRRPKRSASAAQAAAPGTVTERGPRSATGSSSGAARGAGRRVRPVEPGSVPDERECAPPPVDMGSVTQRTAAAATARRRHCRPAPGRAGRRAWPSSGSWRPSLPRRPRGAGEGGRRPWAG